MSALTQLYDIIFIYLFRIVDVSPTQELVQQQVDWFHSNVADVFELLASCYNSTILFVS